jgi:hypothetical protein
VHNIISLSEKNLLYGYENIDLKKHHEISLKKEKKRTFKQTLFVPPKACANGGYSLTQHLT